MDFSDVDFSLLEDEAMSDHEWSNVLREQLLVALQWQPPVGAPVPERVEQIGGTADVFQIVSQTPTRVKSAWQGRFQEFATDYHLAHNLSNINDIYTVASSIDEFINQLVSPVLVQANDNDYVALQVYHEDLATPIYVSFTRKQHFTSQAFLNKIFRFAQSGVTRFLLNGQMTLRVSIYKAFAGAAHNPSVSIEAETYFGRKHDVVSIMNDNHYCGYLALTLGYLYANARADGRCMPESQWRSLRYPRSQTLLMQMLLLCSNLQIDNRMAFDIPMAASVQNKLPEHQLIVIRRPTPTRTFDKADVPLFKGPAREKKIIMEYVSDPVPHFNMVKKMTGYMNCDRWCYECWHSISPDHVCPGSCRDCREVPACIEGQQTSCVRCHVVFVSEMCYLNHIRRNICGRRVRCTFCEVTYFAKHGPHKCDESVCVACSERYSKPPHYCYIKPKSLAKLQEQDAHLKVIVAFDIEARLVETEPNLHEHKANLLISHTVCDSCYVTGQQKTDTCLICGPLEHVYFGDDCVTRFVSHVMDVLQHECHAKKIKRILVLSHNFAGYDGRFLLEELLRRRFIGIESVFNGTKILKLDVGLVRFLDSLSFLPLKLCDLPKSFPHPSIQLKKGTFPYLFNQPMNYAYNGSWPGLEHYQVRSLKLKARRELEGWHMAQQGKTFNFMNELVSYCRTDVQILLHSIQEFRNLFIQASGIDPLTRCFTLASAGLETFRALFLREKRIGITPLEGYMTKRHGSLLAHAWLDYLERELDTKIWREKKIGNYFADGFDPVTNTVYEFHGCSWHGCPSCYVNRHEINPANGRTYQQLYDDLQRKHDYYSRRELGLVFIWEHDLRDLGIPDYMAERKLQLKRARDKAIYSIRDSLSGGRVENYKVLYECREDECLKYVDFTSLYPFVLKRRRFPIGHPVVVTEGLDVDSYVSKCFFGFTYCKVVAPPDIDPPVLPYKFDGKLMFGNCRTCMEQRLTECSHNEDERALDFIFCTAELDRAIECGYRLIEVYAVLHYPETEVGLFGEYIDMFLKIKQEKSGFPPGIETEAQIQQYIRSYEENEGIRLDRAQIEKNEGLRLVSKLMLNNLWGKLVQKPNKPRTTIISDYQSLSALLGNPNIEVIGSHILPNDNAIVTYRMEHDEEAGPGNTSPAIGCFVTAWGRLELLNLMQRVESVRRGRCCYADTDSLIFAHREGDPVIPLGSFLGQLTSEIPAGAFCKRGVFCGCKSYGLEYTPEDETMTVEDVIKIKGLSLTSEVTEKITVNSMAEMVHQFTAQNPVVVQVPQTVFRPISLYDQTMTSRRFEKDFRVTSDKRYLSGFDTLPYGYKT